VLLTLSLFWLDLPNKGTLAIIAWVTEFIPYIWPLLWAIPAVLLALVEYNILGAVIVIWVYYAIQQVENNILVPIVMNKALWISPILIFISMLIGGTTLWFIWVILAVPIAVILTLLYEEIIKK
jgi:predicted PurR-regulated permease PerM